MATTTSSDALQVVVTLLFVHGEGLCKEVWTPIIRRMQQSPLWPSHSSVRFEVEAIDLPYHGSNWFNHRGASATEDSDEPRITYFNKRGLFPSCRVEHPANAWVEWATAAVLRSVDRWRDAHSLSDSAAATPTTPRRLLIGIGHSMGASALWNAEVTRPGSFAGLVLFEPIYGHRKQNATSTDLLDMIVAATLQRESTWSSLDAARQHFAESKRFASWHPESLEHWIHGTIVPTIGDSVTLACSPEIEAAFSCGPALRLSKTALSAPRCPISVHYARDSRLFQPLLIAAMARRLPHIYSLSASPVQRDTSLIVVEDPGACAAEVLDALHRRLPTLMGSAAARL